MEYATASLKDLSVEELATAAKSGGHDEFGELCERYANCIYRVALRRLKNYAAAQDLAQEVFMQAFLKIGHLRQPARFGGWLKSITNRMAINQQTRGYKKFIPNIGVFFENPPVETKTPERIALTEERGAKIRAALQRLKEWERDALTAYYFRRLSYDDMAKEFGKPVGTIKSRLFVARQRLAQVLEQDSIKDY